MPRPSLNSTPEQILGRNDSKNPATTCRGITSSGRPCRRALALSKLATQDVVIEPPGVVALVREDDRLTDAQYFCWQHKDQAQDSKSPLTGSETKPTRRREVLELRSRSSINSLMHALNIQEGNEQQIWAEKRPRPQAHDRNRTHSSRRAPPKQSSFWRSLCCMLAADDDDTIEIVKHRHRVQQGRTALPITASLPSSRKPDQTAALHLQMTPSNHNEPLSLIKQGTSPQVAASLLTELAKPISHHDEDGYIYMFWLTPASQGMPQKGTARDLLEAGAHHGRRLSDVMSDFSVADEQAPPTQSRDRKIMLKIGRANNVTRRMNEWQRQCGYELSLIRWYPYVSHAASRSPRRSAQKPTDQDSLYPDLSQHSRPSASRHESEQVRKVPYVKRVERLIHLELNDQQVKKNCLNCGREHREWFAVDANEQSVRQVDGVIRKWVRWSEDKHVA